MQKKYYHYDFWVNKKPIQFFLPLLVFWHKRMLYKAAKEITNLKSLKILEVGVGFGFFAQVAKKFGCKYIGVDMNKKLVDGLRRKGFEVFHKIVPPFPKTKDVGVIWLSHVLEHSATYLDAREFVNQAYGALKPGGYLVLISPDILSWKIEFWNDDWSHGFPTSLINCTKILNDVGFTVTYKSFHNATVFQPVLQLMINILTQLIPYQLLDFFISPFTKRTFFYSFMTLFGWRQIFLIAKK